MKNKYSLKNFEKSNLLLFAFFIIEIFLIYLSVYINQDFPVEQFVLIIIQLVAILLAYYWGILMAGIFSIVYVVGSIVYFMNAGLSFNFISSFLFFSMPLILLFSGNIKKTREEVSRNLNRLDQLDESYLKVDPHTLLENEVAFEEILSKHTHLSRRYESYFFSVSMLRLEFVETLRTILDVRDFNQLIEDIAHIIQTSIRIEDYKFILDNNRFAIITPFTAGENIKPAIRRILEKVEQLTILDRDGKKLDIVLKYSTIDYSKEDDKIFEDCKQLIFELQKSTEVDVHGEYYN